MIRSPSPKPGTSAMRPAGAPSTTSLPDTSPNSSTASDRGAASPGSPPNAIVFASGYIRVHQMARVGLVLNLISVVLLVLLFQFVMPLLF